MEVSVFWEILYWNRYSVLRCFPLNTGPLPLATSPLALPHSCVAEAQWRLKRYCSDTSNCLSSVNSSPFHALSLTDPVWLHLSYKLVLSSQACTLRFSFSEHFFFIWYIIGLQVKLNICLFFLVLFFSVQELPKVQIWGWEGLNILSTSYLRVNKWWMGCEYSRRLCKKCS